jgi:large subunit ribosomal protein L21
MYAVIETGGKQYRVEVGTELEVELLDAEPGGTITIDRVLLVADGDESTIGRPLVADASVSAEVVSQTRGPKLIAFKYRPKARSRVKKGHRQDLTLLRVADITVGGKSAAKDALKAEDAARSERQRATDAAAAQAAKDAELAARLAVGTEAPAPTRKPSKAKAEIETREPEAKAEVETPEPEAKAEVETPEPEAKADTAAKAKAAPKAEKPKAEAGTETTKAAPKKSTAKAAAADDAPTGTDVVPQDADGETGEAGATPRRSRTTKKDE